MSRTAKPWYRSDRGYWMAWIDGQQVKLVAGDKNKTTKKEAEKELKELLKFRDLVAPVAGGHKPKLTVAGVIQLYLDYAVHRYSPRSFYERKKILEEFAAGHGFQRVNDRDCLPLHLSSWIDERRDRWKSDWTLESVTNAIQRPFNWAAKERLIAANPFRGVTYRSGARRRPMTDEEFARLFAAATNGRKTKLVPTPGERFGELLKFLRLTGMRPGEAANLKWTDIDWMTGFVVMKIHKTIRMQKTPRPRVVPMTVEVTELLTEISGREEGELVFYNHRMTAWNRSNLSLRMRRAREKAGVAPDAKLYGLRHRFGTRCIVQGVDIKTTAELMGHTTTRMTEHYLHLAGEKTHLASAMNRATG